MVISVITFPTVFIYSYCQLIIPEFSTYFAQKNYKAINFVSTRIFKILCAFSFCICSIFWIFSNELGLVIYNNVQIGFYFKIIAPLIIFLYIDHIIDCILKGLNKQIGVMICNIIDLSITIIFMYFLLPIYGIKGYIFSIYFSELLNFSISLIQMIKYSKIKINIYDWLVIPLSCCFISYIFISICHFNLINLITSLILNIGIFILIYTLCFGICNYFSKKTKVYKL